MDRSKRLGIQKGYVNEGNFQTVSPGGVLARRGGNAEDVPTNYEEIPFFDTKDPLSIYNLVSLSVKQHMKLIPPKYMTMNEDALRRQAYINAQDEQTRLAFWDEYAIAKDSHKRMAMDNIYNVTSRIYFYRSIVANPMKLAYILTPPVQYKYRMREILELAHRRMREVLELPIVDKKGNPNVPLIREIVKIGVLAENRVMGAVKQKVEIESKSMNVNINSSEDRKTYFDVEAEIRDIDRKIRELRVDGAVLNLEQMSGQESGSLGQDADEGGVVEVEEVGVVASSAEEGS